MSRTADDLLDEALMLSAEDRVKLAEQLLKSLDAAEQAEIDAAWIEEVERRMDRYRRGESRGVPVDQAVVEVREWLRGRGK